LPRRKAQVEQAVLLVLNLALGSQALSAVAENHGDVGHWVICPGATVLGFRQGQRGLNRGDAMILHPPGNLARSVCAQ
jgi:hypothetical protein